MREVATVMPYSRASSREPAGPALAVEALEDRRLFALSVTPFASGALSRGLTALLVSCIRLQGTEFNANQRASRIDRNHPYVKEAVRTILRRAELVGSGDEGSLPNLKAELNERLDEWLAQAQRTERGRVLVYDEQRDGITVGLLNRPGLDPWDDFTCLNSLRDVEPNVGLIFHDGGLDADPNFVAARPSTWEPRCPRYRNPRDCGMATVAWPSMRDASSAF